MRTCAGSATTRAGSASTSSAAPSSTTPADCAQEAHPTGVQDGRHRHARMRRALIRRHTDGVEARERYRTLHVRMRRTQVPSVALRVMQRWAATRPKGSVMIATSQGARGTSTETDDLSVQESRLWLD